MGEYLGASLKLPVKIAQHSSPDPWNSGQVRCIRSLVGESYSERMLELSMARESISASAFQ